MLVVTANICLYIELLTPLTIATKKNGLETFTNKVEGFCVCIFENNVTNKSLQDIYIYIYIYILYRVMISLHILQ